eukprot:10860480-Lingulodinium_polyedra.AAC.1
MAIEMQAKDGEWLSFMAERLPAQLDDAVKGAKAEFYMSAKDLTPEELQEELPMACPIDAWGQRLPLRCKIPDTRVGRGRCPNDDRQRMGNVVPKGGRKDLEPPAHFRRCQCAPWQR